MTELNEKQLQILQVAERLFAEKGFDGTSVRDIAREASINIAMVSYYFGSKDKMLEALILWRTSDMRLQLETLLKLDADPWEKLEKLIELYINRVRRNHCIYRIIHFELANTQRSIKIEEFNEVKKRNLGMIRQIVEEGQQSGQFRKDIIVELLPATVLGIYFQFHNTRLFYQSVLDLKTDEDFEQYVEHNLIPYIKQVLKALLKNENQ
ncbi:TetR/AcrR family transcriptional regulator [Flavobacterium selenitireducens]|uniref:TetR/AcrR family transcriptional regulator n=1 Tax=Flavobacterium selenitireducens TaxID=2722704 RepID=UPI00168BD256|nr:TetR family transcriptional regulator [Flavobacterium selenitireducens]MBD3583819.1 TetR/AcrR family transcriptional regulator [Flavobacterium selenitireducens]